MRQVTLFLVLAGMAISGNAVAQPRFSCGEKMRELYSKETRYLTDRERADALGRKMTSRAFKDYWSRFDSTTFYRRPYVEAAEAFVRSKRTTGYKITITDGGDESAISYYFTLSGNLIYGKWHNQSPDYYWFCE